MTFRKFTYDILHLIILVLCLFLVISISWDTFHNIAFSKSPQFVRYETYICIAFLADFFIEFFMAHDKKRFFVNRFLFLLVSIPYLAIFDLIGWHYSEKVAYFMRFIPLVRGGYALAMVVGWFTSNRATSLFFTYILTLFATIYFASMVFYVVEKGHNPLVHDYYSALWWAFMDATTVGCNIVAVTAVGKILSVLLAALGMMMFPIFTVYVTNLLTNNKPFSYLWHNNKEAEPAEADSAQTAPAGAVTSSDAHTEAAQSGATPAGQSPSSPA